MPSGIPKNGPSHPQRKKKLPHTGREEIPIDWDIVDKFLIMGCSGVQIAAYLDIHPDTLYHRCINKFGKAFSHYSYEKREKGNAILHSKQWSKAMEGNITMLLRLGEDRLGQAAKVEQKTEFNACIKQKTILELPDNDRRTPTDSTAERTAD